MDATHILSLFLSLSACLSLSHTLFCYCIGISDPIIYVSKKYFSVKQQFCDQTGKMKIAIWSIRKDWREKSTRMFDINILKTW